MWAYTHINPSSNLDTPVSLQYYGCSQPLTPPKNRTENAFWSLKELDTKLQVSPILIIMPRWLNQPLWYLNQVGLHITPADDPDFTPADFTRVQGIN